MYWLKAAYNDGYSFMFSICSGVRQGSVLSPLLFALFIHDISQLCDPRNPCCVVIMIYSGVQVMSSPARRSVLVSMIVQFRQCLHVATCTRQVRVTISDSDQRHQDNDPCQCVLRSQRHADEYVLPTTQYQPQPQTTK